MYFLERVPEMQKHQVALVPDQRVQSRLVRVWAARSFFHSGKESGGFLYDVRPLQLLHSAPGAALEPEHLVQHIGAFQCERDCRSLSHVGAPILLPGVAAYRSGTVPQRLLRIPAESLCE